MAEPFERRSSDDGILSRIVGGGKNTQALREIEALLADAERLSQIPRERLAEVAETHGVDLSRRLRTPRTNLYRRFFEYCLLDQAVSEDERADLAHLRLLLHLDDEDVARVHDEVSRSVYGKAVDQVLDDHRLDPDEEAFLRQLRDELHMPESEAKELLEEGSERARRRYLDRTIARDDFLVTSRDITLDLSGTSETAIEDAIRSTVEEAGRAVDGLSWVEITQIGAEVEGGRVARWHVKLKAKRANDD